MMMLIISAPHNKTFDLWLELEFGGRLRLADFNPEKTQLISADQLNNQ